MGTMLVRFLHADQVLWGKLEGNAPRSGKDQVTARPLSSSVSSTRELIALFDSQALEYGARLTFNASQLLSPITTDSTLVCQGLNYSEHAAEAQQHTRRSNLIFAKASSALTGAYSPIVRPSEVQLLDYEVEIGLVLRSDLTADAHVDHENIGRYVAGVVLCNDVSARDTMFGASFLQWFHGKSYRTFCPAGPVLYCVPEAETAETLKQLTVKLWLNGELRQSASSSQLIYKPAETLTHLAQYMDLKRGDVLLTGTPGGVTSPASPVLVEILKTHLMADETRRDKLRLEMVKTRPFMQPGDVVSSTLVDDLSGLSLGGQENTIALPRPREAVGASRRAP
jgi:2-keto-4-pentenoate hydratase/2-oxohepta-3-ene-1,7-dioic acid hydratase in catechol pathway